MENQKKNLSVAQPEMLIAKESEDCLVLSGASKDMSKAAMFISMLGVALLVIFFFGLGHKLSSIESDLEGLSNLDTEVAQVDNQLKGMSQRVKELESLPERARNLILGDALQEMAVKMDFMKNQMLSNERKQKLEQAKKLLDQLHKDLSQN